MSYTYTYLYLHISYLCNVTVYSTCSYVYIYIFGLASQTGQLKYWSLRFTAFSIISVSAMRCFPLSLLHLSAPSIRSRDYKCGKPSDEPTIWGWFIQPTKNDDSGDGLWNWVNPTVGSSCWICLPALTLPVMTAVVKLGKGVGLHGCETTVITAPRWSRPSAQQACNCRPLPR